MPRMTNTYMRAGDRDPEEILAGVKNGLYAKTFGGGQVDITSGKFVFTASEAYLIENGRIAAPVKGATLIGNGPDCLTRVRAVGNDLALDRGIGTCGKEGQWVPVGVGQPTLLIEGLTVGGTAPRRLSARRRRSHLVYQLLIVERGTADYLLKDSRHLGRSGSPAVGPCRHVGPPTPPIAALAHWPCAPLGRRRPPGAATLTPAQDRVILSVTGAISGTNGSGRTDFDLNDARAVGLDQADDMDAVDRRRGRVRGRLGTAADGGGRRSRVRKWRRARSTTTKRRFPLTIFTGMTCCSRCA